MVELSSAPVGCLRDAALSLLELGLDARKVLPSESGACRDWKGLVDAADLPRQLVSKASEDRSPTRFLIDHWKKAPLHKANLKLLKDALAAIDRYDVLDDVAPLLDADAAHFFESRKTECYQIERAPLAERGLADLNILTVHDAELSRQGSPTYQTYDAFVLFADEDYDFAAELIRRMEDYGLKICCRDDLVAGNLTHSSMLTIISERCTRLIIIITPDFISSPNHKYFIDYAQVLGIEKRERKLIPFIYKSCPPELFPPPLKNLFALNYVRSGGFSNFWERLRDSLRTTPFPVQYTQRAICEPVPYSSSLPAISSSQSHSPRIEYPSSEIDEIAAPPSETQTNSVNSLLVPERVISKSVENLTVLKPEHDLASSVFSNSSISLSVSENKSCESVPNEKTSKEKTSKNKWLPKLPKFLNRSSSHNIEMCNHDPNAHKKKKKWLKKKVVPLNAS